MAIEYEKNKEAFLQALEQLIASGIDDMRSADDYESGSYHAFAVKKIFEKCINSAEKLPDYNAVLFRKFVAYYLLDESHKLGLAKPGYDWLLFTGDNPEKVPEYFYLENEKVFKQLKEELEKLATTNALVLIFDKLSARYGSPERAVREVLSLDQQGIEKFANSYGFDSATLYEEVLKIINSKRENRIQNYD